MPEDPAQRPEVRTKKINNFKQTGKDYTEPPTDIVIIKLSKLIYEEKR